MSPRTASASRHGASGGGYAAYRGLGLRLYCAFDHANRLNSAPGQPLSLDALARSAVCADLVWFVAVHRGTEDRLRRFNDGCSTCVCSVLASQLSER